MCLLYIYEKQCLGKQWEVNKLQYVNWHRQEGNQQFWLSVLIMPSFIFNAITWCGQNIPSSITKDRRSKSCCGLNSWDLSWELLSSFESLNPDFEGSCTLLGVFRSFLSCMDWIHGGWNGGVLTSHVLSCWLKYWPSLLGCPFYQPAAGAAQLEGKLQLTLWFMLSSEANLKATNQPLTSLSYSFFELSL